jgi:hypothetical protein
MAVAAILKNAFSLSQNNAKQSAHFTSFIASSSQGMGEFNDCVIKRKRRHAVPDSFARLNKMPNIHLC